MFLFPLLFLVGRFLSFFSDGYLHEEGLQGGRPEWFMGKGQFLFKLPDPSVTEFMPPGKTQDPMHV